MIADPRPGPEVGWEADDNWSWCDALFMAPPAWAALSRVTGDPRYSDYAIREYLATQDYLFDKQDKLYYRDSRFFEQRTEFGNKIFWSRGNGSSSGTW